MIEIIFEEAILAVQELKLELRKNDRQHHFKVNKFYNFAHHCRSLSRQNALTLGIPVAAHNVTTDDAEDRTVRLAVWRCGIK